MNSLLDEVLKAAATGQRIDPASNPDAVTFLFNSDVALFDVEKFRGLLRQAMTKFGIELEVTGGGAGCFRIICEGKPPERIVEMLTSADFIRSAGDAGVEVIFSSKLHVPVKAHLEALEPLADFAIVTPLIEEFRPLRKALRQAAREERRIQKGVMSYYTYPLSTKGGKFFRVVASFMPRMGNDSAAITTFHMINDWRPRFMLLMGIAGGLDPTKLALGDVVIADEVLRYDRRRKERESGTEWAPNAYPTDRLLLNRAQALLLEDEIIEKWCQERVSEANGVGQEPNAEIGNLACGDAVVDSEEYKKEIKRLNRTIAAFEMEGGGFLEAAINQAIVAKALVLRGISDFAANKDATDSDGRFDWRGYAAANVATFLVKFIEQFEDDAATKPERLVGVPPRPHGRPPGGL
jgi:nucleoside phosphorylase